jgi:cation transport regulator ChaC
MAERGDHERRGSGNGDSQRVPAVPDDGLWYFAYGSNLHDTIFRERRAMQARATHPGWLDGFELRFNLPIGPGERAVANIEPLTGARVWGALYLLTAADCERLDRSEGVHFGAYRRIDVAVCLEDGTRHTAFTYCSTRTRTDRKPSARYLGLMVEGARQRGLPDEYVRWLERFELAHDEREPPAA